MSARRTYLFLLVLSAGLWPGLKGIAQNAPVSNPSSVCSYTGTASIAVTSSGFTDIGSFSLKILYDTAIAHPTSVTAGPQLGGNFTVSLAIPGCIFISWYDAAGLTLPGNPVVLNIVFSRVAFGTTSLTWLDEGISCAWFDGNGVMLNDQPFSAYYLPGELTFASPDAPHLILPEVEACFYTTCTVPVLATAFNTVGKFNLKFTYDPTHAGYQSFTNTSGFPGLTVDGSIPGQVLVSGQLASGTSGITLPDTTTLFSMTFLCTGGTTALTWTDNGPSCQFSGPPPGFSILNDIPQNVYYTNGLIEEPAPPVILSQPVSPPAIPAGNGTAWFSVEAAGTGLTYQWQELRDDWTNLADSGIYSGSQTPALTLTDPPVAMNGYHYRCLISGTCPPSLPTNGEASLAVDNMTGTGWHGTDPGIRITAFSESGSGIIQSRISIPEKGNVEMGIYTICGARIEQKRPGSIEKGTHTLAFQHYYSRGIYFLTLKFTTPAGTFNSTVKLVVP